MIRHRLAEEGANGSRSRMGCPVALLLLLALLAALALAVALVPPVRS